MLRVTFAFPAARSAGEGYGSEFEVRLPLGTIDSMREPNDDIGTRGSDGRRVLIVDDNQDAAQILAMLIESFGNHDVRTAGGGQEALAIAEEQRPDIVLLDLQMPGIDGYETAKRMRRTSWGKEAVLVALTGWAQERHQKLTEEAGFDRHLTKPADAATLAALLADSAEADSPNGIQSLQADD